MTGPEAIAAAERLLEDIDAKMKQTSADLDACRLLAVSAQVVRGLRAALLQSQAELYNHVACMVTEDSLRERAEVAEEALLQSQEALTRLANYNRADDGLQCWCGVSVGIGAEHAEYCLAARAAVFSPPVAPKVECMCGQQGSADRFQCHGGGRRCLCSCHLPAASKER